MNISQLLSNGSIIDIATGVYPLPPSLAHCTRVLACDTILAAYNWALGQIVAKHTM